MAFGAILRAITKLAAKKRPNVPTRATKGRKAEDRKKTAKALKRLRQSKSGKETAQAAKTRNIRNERDQQARQLKRERVSKTAQEKAVTRQEKLEAAMDIKDPTQRSAAMRKALGGK